VRFFLSVTHTIEQFDDTIDTIAAALSGARPRPKAPGLAAVASH
jgi:hypothetical protein